MTPFVVDASLWVARLIAKDIFHQDVSDWMSEKRDLGLYFVAPSLLLSEIAGVISRRTNSPDLAEDALDHLQALPELHLVEMDARLTRLAAKLAARLGLRGVDAFYTAVADYLHLPLVTLDRDQALRSAYRVEVIHLSGR